TIMLDDTDLSAGETATVTITFSEAVTGFDNDDLTVPNGTLTAVSSSDGGITFTGTFTPTADFESATNVIVLDNTGVIDGSLNPGVGTTESDNFTIDTVRPDVTISSSEVSPTNSSPFSVSVIFSEGVTGFEESDVIVGNGSVSLFAGSGTTYIIIVTPVADGQVTVDIDENVAVNGAGNGNTEATQFSIEYDGTSPNATITSSESSPTSSNLIPITITFDESVDGFDINDISVNNGSASFFGGSGSSYIAVITPIANGLVIVDIPEDSATDVAGNGNNAATQFTILYEGSVVLLPKVLLQGPLFNPATPGLMNDILREDGHLPTTSPYADGLIVDANVFNAGGSSGTGLADDNIVDWVWVELRDKLDNTLVVTGQSALLQRDGDVVGLDGLSDLSILAAPNNYYVVINHRNHLSAMSFGTITLSETPVVVDFTDSLFTTFGSNSQVMLGSGDMALWAGDVNGDELVRYLGPSNDTSTIKDSILSDPGNTTGSNFYPFTGYDNGDIDMNGQIRYLGPGNDSALLKDVILSFPDNSTSSNFFPVSGQTPN
ncbi:MAG: hypothetical protein HKO72_09215, partial [Flavobacteriaceae bacterium]|nr:hypothetical protein [Bacteroidia bacterium]NNL61498.1 hypothetical protein [Flavobacteriaceae bacterium]